MFGKSLFLAAVCLVSHASAVHAVDPPALTDFPFWRKMSGWWASDNTYFTPDMDYTVRAYNSLVHIELTDGTFRETEHRFYPAGMATTRYGQGLMQAGEGVELIVTITAEMIDDRGTLGNIRADHSGGPFNPDARYRVLSEADGVRVTPDPETGHDSYRMYFSFPAPNHRYRAHFGLIYDAADDVGGLRSFVLYRDKRIDGASFAAWRAEFRARHNVKVISVADPDHPGQSTVSRLD